jgi:hypothetical protein
MFLIFSFFLTLCYSDYPKRNPRRASTSKSKGVASGGYASRPTAESSTKKIEQSSNDEGDFSRANGSLYGEAAEQASTAEESSQVYMTGDILSGAEWDRAGTEEEADQNALLDWCLIPVVEAPPFLDPMYPGVPSSPTAGTAVSVCPHRHPGPSSFFSITAFTAVYPGAGLGPIAPTGAGFEAAAGVPGVMRF